MPEENKAPSFILKSLQNEILPYWLKPHVIWLKKNVLTGYVFYSLRNSWLPKKVYLSNDNKCEILIYLLW